jgi:hypothetical protein
MAGEITSYRSTDNRSTFKKLHLEYMSVGGKRFNCCFVIHLKCSQGMWAVNGRSVRTGETTLNRQMHSYGLSTLEIDCVWATARKSYTVYSSKTYAFTLCLLLSPIRHDHQFLETGRCIFACLCQQTRHSGLYDGPRNSTG